MVPSFQNKLTRLYQHDTLLNSRYSKLQILSMNHTNDIQIRKIQKEDYAAWKLLWKDYLTFYQASLSDAVIDNTFKQLLTPDISPHGLIAVDYNGKIVGLAHYLFHVTTWAIAPACYLQDLFVDPSARKKHIGSQLMSAVHEAAKQENASLLHWMTEKDNVTARILYDKVGYETPFIRYKWNEQT